MKYGSVCSGVEAATVAWHPLGWEPQWFCEFDKFPSAVLDYRFPNVPNLGDMVNIEKHEVFNDRSINLLVGGTPCQSFSVAGLRKGLDDDRGNLALKYCEILDRKRPSWFLWENVPGVFSSNEGRDLLSIFSGFRECGYQFAYRVLDAQYFGVPQRRRRIFVVGYIGDWRPAAAVLFEPESLFWDIAPDRAEGKDLARETAKCLTARGAGGLNHDAETANFVINGNVIDRTENSGGNGKGWTNDGTVPTLRTTDRHAIVSVHGTQDPNVLEEKAHTLGGNHGQENAICFAQNSRRELREMPYSGALSAQPGMTQTSFVRDNMVVRRFTPIECERLQGFPDNWTQIPWRGKPAEQCPDGPRYKCMGNSMAVPVMKWLGQRIQKVEELL